MESHLFEQIYKLGIIPVIQIDNADRAVPLADALAAGGLPIGEITLHTEAALDSIRNITRDLPHILVGTGTVINREQAQVPCETGAQFLVSPGLDEELIGWAQEKHVPIIPGAVTPTEIMHAIRLGLTLLKFFPADAMGGPKTLNHISDPFPQVHFIPTGGIRLENLAQYLRLRNIYAAGGSWMATRHLIDEGRFDEIIRMAKATREIVKHIRR
jgi:2-dehydro-3-deoxyphosphogluconate aldolase / (4S)-4-hydroxy-2-oxoglutarate aldolase